MHQKWETVLSKREHSFMGHSLWKISRSVLFFVIAFLWIVEPTQLLFILYHCVLAMFLILKNCQVSDIFCHCFSLNSGSRSFAVYFVIRWCPGHPWFLHQFFFHWHSPAWFCTRFLHQAFFLCHSPAWFCTRFKLWKWNCSAIWHNLSSFCSNLHKFVVQSYCSIRWCPGHPCFLHQAFFLWHNPAWICTKFKLWKWNCSEIWHNLSSFHSNLQKNWCRPIVYAPKVSDCT
jgi:hypothetical protein